MSQLYDLKQRALKIMADKKMDPVRTSGQIGLQVGILLPFINENTPDDAVKIVKFKAAIKEVLGVNV